MPDGMDKCDCGRWKGVKYDRCGSCSARAKNAARPHSGGRPRGGQNLVTLKFPGAYYTKASDMRKQGLSWRAIGDLLDVDDKGIKCIRLRLSRLRKGAPSPTPDRQHNIAERAG